MSKRLMPTYLVEFLKSGYNGDIPTNFGQRMVSRQAIAFTKKLYDIFVESNAPVNFGRSMLPEYLVKFLDDLRSSDFIVFEDDDTAFIKDVPDISDISCKINIIGGMSYKSENLIVLSDVAETTLNDITYKVENGVITLNGTASESTKFSFQFTNPIPKNQDYYAKLFISGTTTAANPKAIGETNTDVRLLIPSTTTFNVNYDINYFWFSAGTGTVWTDYIIKPMIVKGTTAPTEWKQGFEGIRDSVVTSVVSKDSSNNTVDTITIDASVQALEGYGQSNPDDPTEYNYIDLENKKYIEVGYIDNGVWISKNDEIDISAYIDTNIIDIKENGTLTFTNTYDQAVPSSVDYYIPKEAFSNGN